MMAAHSQVALTIAMFPTGYGSHSPSAFSVVAPAAAITNSARHTHHTLPPRRIASIHRAVLLRGGGGGATGAVMSAGDR